MVVCLDMGYTEVDRGLSFDALCERHTPTSAAGRRVEPPPSIAAAGSGRRAKQ
jgi:hypothetical protein